MLGKLVAETKCAKTGTSQKIGQSAGQGRRKAGD